MFQNLSEIPFNIIYLISLKHQKCHQEKEEKKNKKKKTDEHTKYNKE